MIGLQARRLQAVARLAHRLEARAEADDAGLGACLHLDERLRHEFSWGLEFLSERVGRLSVGFLIFGIFRVGVVARAAREVGSPAVGVAGNGSIGNPVAVLIEVAAELLPLLLPLLQVGGGEELAGVARP